MDVLADVLSATRIGNAILCGAEFEAPWGIKFDLESRTHFHIVSRGSCWLRLDAESKPLQLFQGDVALIPFGGGHILSDKPETPALSLAQVLSNCSRNGQNNEQTGSAKQVPVQGRYSAPEIHFVPVVLSTLQLTRSRFLALSPPAFLPGAICDLLCSFFFLFF